MVSLNKDNKKDLYYDNNQILEDIKLHGSRKIVAKRLKDSYQNKIHATIYRYIEIDKLREFKEKNKSGSMVDHFVRAIALSLNKKPELNATFDGVTHRIYKDINICYAVNTKRGLVTPVLKKADKLSLESFLYERKRVIDLVLDWKHELKDIMGGTFTITNMGNFGVDFTLPIINPPQVAILGMSRNCKMNISWDGSSPRERELIPISITYDHSVIDGAGVAEFVQILQDRVNKPDDLWK